MSFFGIDNNDLENEKRRYLEGNLDDGSDIPVYTWGTGRYESMGDALQEGGDDLNDETFGGTGPVGAFHPFCPYSLPLTPFLCRQGFRFLPVILRR